MNKRYKNRKAFTLIELLIVIGIIAVLSSAIVVAINPGQQFAQARDASRRSHINSIRQAVLSYQIDNQGNLPTELLNSVGGEICNPSAASCPTDSIDLSFLTPNYIASIPVDPEDEETSETTGYGIANVGNRIATWATEPETRLIGKRPALDFDGSDDYVEISGGDSVFDLTSQGAIALWVKINTFDDLKGLIGKCNSTAWKDTNYGIVMRGDYAGSNKVQAVISDGSNYEYASSSELVNNKWYHLTMTWDDNNIKIYKNGIIDNIENQNYTPQIDDDPITIGTWGNTNSSLDSVIDDVRIYNRALSENEINSLYKGQNITNGLVGYWPLNEGQGGVAYDRSGNGNDGTLMPNFPDNSPEWTIHN